MSSLRCIPRFPPEALQNLLETHDFLSVSSDFNSLSAPTYTSTFPVVIPTTSNPSNLLGCKNIPRVHLAELESSLDELAESLFPYETDPNIFSTSRVELSRRYPQLMVKKSPIQPLRRASVPQRDQTIPLTQREPSNSNLELMSNLPADYLAETPYETGEESMVIDAVPSNSHRHGLPDLEDGGEIPRDNYDYSEDSNIENSPSKSSPSNSSSSSSSTSNPDRPLTLPELCQQASMRGEAGESTVAPIIENVRQSTLVPIVVDVPLRTPQYNMEQVASAFKQSITGGLNLQKPLFIIDTPNITGEQAAKFQNQANQWHDNFFTHQVVVDPATYVIQYAFASDPEFTTLPKDKFSTWYNHVTVKQAATIITKYFGDKNDVGRTLVENFASIVINFSFTNETYERETSYINTRRTAETRNKVILCTNLLS